MLPQAHDKLRSDLFELSLNHVRDIPKVPTELGDKIMTYFFPVLSRLGLMSPALRAANASSMGAVEYE